MKNCLTQQKASFFNLTDIFNIGSRTLQMLMGGKLFFFYLQYDIYANIRISVLRKQRPVLFQTPSISLYRHLLKYLNKTLIRQRQPLFNICTTRLRYSRLWLSAATTSISRGDAAPRPSSIAREICFCLKIFGRMI